MSFIIDNYDEHCPQLRIKSGDREISFTVKDVDPEARGWLGSTLDRQITELVEHRVYRAVEAHKAQLRELLGAKP